jgi:glycosyltransferase involved in cell wall biosynthesis
MTDARIREAGIKLLVAGEFYAQPDKYYEIVERLKLKDHIIFYSDYIPDHEIPVFFSAADVIVQPYKSATQSGVTQIAYQYDKPMIVTNVGGLPEIVPHGRAGFVVDKDPKQIANAIIEFYSGEKKVNMEKQVREEKKKYTWENFVDNIMKLFDQIKHTDDHKK